MTYEVGQMDVAIGIQQHIVRLDVPVHNTLLMYISNGTSKLGYPEPYGLLCECLARDVKAKITAVHQIDHDVSTVGQYSRLALIRHTRTGIRCPGSCISDCRGRGG
jgi:hypothetical protein